MSARLTVAASICLAALSMLAVGPTAAEVTRDVGYVIDFDGYSEDYRLIRAGEEIPLSLLMPVRRGDELSVLTSAGRLTVRIGSHDQAPLILREEDSPYFVDISGSWMPIPVFWPDLFDEITIQRDYALADGGVMGVSRLEMPLTGLTDGTARMQAGARRFAIGWLGDHPPFAVTVTDQATGQVVDQGETSDPHYLSGQSVSFDGGLYAVEVRDAAGATVGGTFAVLSPEKVPGLPEDLTIPEALADLADVFTAAWLATRDDGIWALEAYQRAAPLAGEATAAAALADALAQGWLPEAR